MTVPLWQRRSGAATPAHSGQVLVIATVAFTVFMAVAAMAIDFGTYLVIQRQLQNAADGAALAGAAELGDPDAPLAASQSTAAQNAVVYLDENLALGMTAAQQTAAASTINSPNGYCHPSPSDCAAADYQFWIYTPSPSATAVAASGLPDGTRKVYLNPQKFPSRTRTMFVRVDRPGSLFFGRIVSSAPPVIATQAIAGPSGKRCAVGALKPRLGSPDNNLGITLNAAQIYISRGDACSNFSINWASSGAKIEFTGGTGDQVVYLAEPAAQQGTESVVNGTVDVLSELLEDPRYTYPLPGTGTAIVDRPPAGAFPSCVSAANVAAGVVQCNATGWSTVPSDFTLYPGKYKLIDVPNGKNVTLSRDCFAGDSTCRQGVYWFSVPATSCTGPNKGGLWLTGSSTPSSIKGQGVLLVFDPLEGGPGCMSFDVSSSNATLEINNSVNMRSSANPSGTIPYAWYNPSDTDPLADPISVWVRPNYVTGGTSYNLTTVSSNGSNVVRFNSNPNVFENGLIYGPEDNAVISGNGSANGVGQVITWTITYSGSGTSLAQSFAGGSADRSRLIQ